MYKKEERKGERRRGDIWDFPLRSNATSAIKRRERGRGLWRSRDVVGGNTRQAAICARTLISVYVSRAGNARFLLLSSL